MPVIISLLALICPVLSFFFIILYFRKTKHSTISSLLFGLMMAAVFYGYQADSGADIYRHVYWLNLYRGIPLSKCFNAGHYNNLFVWDIWCWIIAQFDNPNLLQASGALVTYSLSSYIVFDTAKRNKGNNSVLAYSLLFVIGLLRTRDVVLGIRSAAAFAILSFAAYRRIVQRKNAIGCIALAVAACLVHISVGQFLLIFLFMPILEKNYRESLLLFFVFAIGIGSLSQWILNYIPKNGTIIAEIITSALLQANDTAQMVHSLSFNSWVNKWWEVGVCIVAVIRVMAYEKTQHNSEANPTGEKAFWRFSLICFAMNLGYCIGLKQNGDRMLTINEIAMLPQLVSIWCNDGVLKKKRYLMLDVVLTGGVIVLFLLHMYSMLWGTASSESLFIGVLLGIVPALFQ